MYLDRNVWNANMKARRFNLFNFLLFKTHLNMYRNKDEMESHLFHDKLATQSIITLQVKIGHFYNGYSWQHLGQWAAIVNQDEQQQHVYIEEDKPLVHNVTDDQSSGEFVHLTVVYFNQVANENKQQWMPSCLFP